MVNMGHTEELLLDQVKTAIEADPHISRRRVQCETDQGTVRLRGSVQSYFEKQIAQEIIRRVDGVETIENLLEVPELAAPRLGSWLTDAAEG